MPKITSEILKVTVGKSEIMVYYTATPYDPGDRETPPCQGEGEVEVDDVVFKERSVIEIIWELGGPAAMRSIEKIVIDHLEGQRNFHSVDAEREVYGQ